MSDVEETPEEEETEELAAELPEDEKPIEVVDQYVPDRVGPDGSRVSPRGQLIICNDKRAVWFPSAPMGMSDMDVKLRQAHSNVETVQEAVQRSAQRKNEPTRAQGPVGQPPEEVKEPTANDYVMAFRAFLVAGLAYNYVEKTVAEILDSGAVDSRQIGIFMLAYQGAPVSQNRRFQQTGAPRPT